KLITVVSHKQAIYKMHFKNGYQHGEGQGQSRRTGQHTQNQGQSAKKLGTTGEQRHQCAWSQTNTFQPAGCALQAITTKPAKQLLCTMGSKNHPYGNTQRQGAPATVC